MARAEWGMVGHPILPITGVRLIMSLRSNVVAGIAVMVLLWSSPVFASDLASLVYAPEVISTLPAKQEVSCELKVRERYEFYDISGNNFDELRKQMKQNGTKWNDGNVYSGLTSWDIKYSYDISHDSGRYLVKSANTKVDIIYRLPRMMGSVSNPELTILWSNYFARLQLHEFGHKDLAVKTGSEINEMFASLPTFTSKDELRKEITRRTEEKFKRLKEIQVEYDHETRHGQTQGAVMPVNVALGSAGN